MLTQEQEAAVTTSAHRSLVMAGAGSGKTTLLTERVLHLIENGAHPSTVMPITFTRRAAKELSERIGPYSSEMPIGTFHAICLRALSEDGLSLNVLDEEQADALLDECAIGLGLAVMQGDKPVYRKHSRAHYRRHIEHHRDTNTVGNSPLTDTYLSRLSLAGDTDYSGILHAGIRIAKDDGGMLGRVRHIILDEAQDTTALQWRLVEEVGKRASIMAVGDVAQNLFSWAGATPEYFASLPWETFGLTETFRCPENVTRLCNTFPMEHVTLRTQKEARETKVFMNDDVEGVVQWLLREGAEEKDIAVLCRYNSQVDEYRDRLSHAGHNVRIPRWQPRGPAFRMLMYMSNLSSVTAREAMKKEWSGISAASPISHMLSDMSCSSVAMLVKNWLASVSDKSCGGILQAAGIANAYDAPYYMEAYGGHSLKQFAIEASLIEPSSISGTHGVTVDTVHSTKGGEWMCVVIPGLNEWPRGVPKADDWRVFYVAATRTIDTICLMCNGEPKAIMQHCLENI